MFPVLFEIFNFEIRSYGVLIAAGILAGVFFAGKETRRRNLPDGIMAEFIPYGVIFGLLLSRLVYVFTHIDYFISHPAQTLNFRAGGLNFFGGLAGGFITALIYLKIRKILFRPFADCAAVALPAALFFGRIGCFLNGCCHGIPSKLPWAVTYANPRSSAVLHTPVHPTQLYEAGGNLLIFGLLWAIRKKKMSDGTLFSLFLLLYSLMRLFLERIRADTLAYITPGFAWTELFFIVIMASAAIIIFNSNRGKAKCRKKQKRQPVRKKPDRTNPSS